MLGAHLEDVDFIEGKIRPVSAFSFDCFVERGANVRGVFDVNKCRLIYLY